MINFMYHKDEDGETSRYRILLTSPKCMQRNAVKTFTSQANADVRLCFFISLLVRIITQIMIRFIETTGYYLSMNGNFMYS